MSQKPVRVAIDASRSTRSQLTGTETYSLRLIQSLIAANESAKPPLMMSLYFRDRPPANLFERSDYVAEAVVPFPKVWTHLRFAAELWKSRPDTVFVPSHSLPVVFPGRAAVTIHDLGFKRFPGAHPLAQRAYLDATTRFSQARADLVFADSRATASDLARFYGTPENKIRVIYPGVDSATSGASGAEKEAVRAKHRLPRRYFLFLGTLQPRKNIKRLVDAFARWQASSEDQQTALVLAGAKGWLFEDAWLKSARNVRVTGYVDEADKGALLAGAIALVFPSLHEGFGFPAVEAMQAGAPVIASNTSSLAEIIGDSGLLVDPLDIDAIASAMARISDDEQLRRDLTQRGRRRAKRFTWESAAEQVLTALREISAKN